MKLNKNSKKLVKQFNYITRLYINEKNQDDGFLDLFLFQTNGRNFNYDIIHDNLLENVADYSLSCKIKKDYKNKPMILSQKARENFKQALKNSGELGELLLFCFLEGHLGASKILTKLSLKTSSQLYFNGFDAVHLKKISEKNYHLIFGESKTYKNLLDALKDAFESINKFKNSPDHNSGIYYEKSLISKYIEQDVFDCDDEEVLTFLMYPSENKADTDIKLYDAFSIFIGYEIDISKEREKCLNDEFEKVVENKVVSQIKHYQNNIMIL